MPHAAQRAHCLRKKPHHLSLCVLSAPSPPPWRWVTSLRPHLDNLGSSHLKSLYLITPVDTLGITGDSHRVLGVDVCIFGRCEALLRDYRALNHWIGVRRPYLPFTSCFMPPSHCGPLIAQGLPSFTASVTPTFNFLWVFDITASPVCRMHVTKQDLR